MSKPTVSLQMIIKDEVDAMINLLTDALPYFTEVNLTVSDKPACNKLKKFADKMNAQAPDGRAINVKYRSWTDDFAAARNANLEMCRTDYFFWLDADDRFDFKQIPGLVAHAEANAFELIYLPYDYAQDEDGNTVALHWRERLIRTGAGFEWRGVVHENLLRDTYFKADRLDQPVVHHHAGNPMASKLRNHKILLKQVEGKALEDVDPRDLHYLGISFFGMHQYKEAINMLQEYIKVGGWDEEIYRSYIKVSECYFLLDMFSEAVENALKACYTLPHYPNAYLTLARYDYAQGRWKECLNWIEVAFSKPDPKSMSIQNPQALEYAKFQAATCYFQLHEYKKAFEYLKLVPAYLAEDITEEFKHEANVETFVSLVPQLVETGFLSEKGLYGSLVRPLQYDPRLRWLKNKVVEAKSWPEKSVVFFCGKGYEEWGAHTLDKGMGGSEEAVVYLSRELTKKGFDVTIFGEVEKPMLDNVDWLTPDRKPGQGAVHYKPWQEFDVRDTFDTVVCWRAPQYAEKLAARVKIVDLHDVLPEEQVPVFENTLYFAKSQYHKSLLAHVPDEQVRVIGNGIVSAQFSGEIEKAPHSVGYFSAYYRGLECLLDMWPQIRAKVPDATLDIYYGWQSWVAFQGEDDFYVRCSAKIADLADQGVVEHGRVSHMQLAHAMQKTQVWAYPTQFPETHCITALKAQQALCYPVTTDVAALAETVQSGEQIKTDIIYTNEYEQAKFIAATVAALEEEKLGTPVPGVDWKDVADQWINVINEEK